MPTTDLIRLAAEHAADLPAGVVAQVEAFRRTPPPAGCLLLRGMPVGHLPPTPAHPTDASGLSPATEITLLSVASLLGEAVGYLPEHNGDLVQNIVPVPSAA
ncbi:MAG TPA: hypothetical protein PLV68_20545, partial [Ilumatobacteraceae bacterium]|nr:hypothetical protein [Ilumatobacteraceae bacterium]